MNGKGITIRIGEPDPFQAEIIDINNDPIPVSTPDPKSKPADLFDPDEISFDILMDTDAKIPMDLTVDPIKIIWPSGAVWSFYGLVVEYFPVDTTRDRIHSQITIKVDGMIEIQPSRPPETPRSVRRPISAPQPKPKSKRRPRKRAWKEPAEIKKERPGRKHCIGPFSLPRFYRNPPDRYRPIKPMRPGDSRCRPALAEYGEYLYKKTALMVCKQSGDCIAQIQDPDHACKECIDRDWEIIRGHGTGFVERLLTKAGRKPCST